jgi:hypothetical protein
MFDGTDLSLAYGSVYDPTVPMGPAVPVQQPPVEVPPPPPVPKATASHAQPPDLPYNPPAAMYTQQPGPVPKKLLVTKEESMWDRISSKKMEVFKMFALSLVVLLALSMDKIASHYLTTYIGKAFLTDIQEFLVRLSYPVIVLLVLWVFKALA